MGLLVTVCVAAAGVLLLVWAFQRALIYCPLDDVPAPSDVGLAGVETVTFPTEDGLMLGGWFVPSRSAVASGTVIVFNGNAANRAYRAPIAAALRDHGYQVLLFDYRGYGGNGGVPTEAGLLEDARAARAFLLGRADVYPSRLVYFGESLGTGVAIALAAEFGPAAMVLRSPFTSLVDVGRHHYPFLPVNALLRDRFPHPSPSATCAAPSWSSPAMATGSCRSVRVVGFTTKSAPGRNWWSLPAPITTVRTSGTAQR